MTAVLEAIRAHAAECQPHECCGLVVFSDDTQIYVPCRNRRKALGQFEIHPADWAAAEDAGQILKIVHSHVYRNPAPSMADRVGCEAHGLPWLIVSWPTGDWFEFEPSGYEAPLVGREFVWGVFDCFTLVRDYYRRELDILIHDCGGYAEDVHLEASLYEARWAQCGFVAVGDLREGDVLLMNIPSAGAGLQHAAIYLGDNTILHHLQGRLSLRQAYGGIWAQMTQKVLRHSSRC